MNARIALAATALSCTAALANAPAGKPAPAFTVTDLDGKPVNLADYKGKTVVLEWTNFGCPFVQKHYRSGNMQALQKKYANDVVWLAVNSTHRGSSDWTDAAPLTAQLRDFGAQPARYLVDEPGKVGIAYGAKTTPHMFIIDPKGTLLYMGGIDSIRSTSLEDVPKAQPYVKDAMQRVASGQAVNPSVTQAYGCTIKYKPTA